MESERKLTPKSLRFPIGQVVTLVLSILIIIIVHYLSWLYCISNCRLMQIEETEGLIRITNSKIQLVLKASFSELLRFMEICLLLDFEEILKIFRKLGSYLLSFTFATFPSIFWSWKKKLAKNCPWQVLFKIMLQLDFSLEN